MTLREAEIFGAITDHHFRTGLIEAGKEEHVVPSFSEAMATLASRNGDLGAAYEALAQSNVGQYVEWLRNAKGRQAGSAIRGCFQGFPSEDSVVARARLREAMYEVSKDSEINKVRMMRYRIVDKDGAFLPDEKTHP